MLLRLLKPAAYRVLDRHDRSCGRLDFCVRGRVEHFDARNHEVAAALLAEAEFKDGIEAGVPAGLRVAHKFGEFKDGQSVESHDCGIVYAESRTYTLCVMTRGKKAADLAEVIANVSRIVYEGQKSL